MAQSKTPGRSDITSTEDSIIEIRDLCVNFELDRGNAQVLDHIDLNIIRGETLGVVGESGSGKSMFASALLDAVVKPGQLTGEVSYYPQEGDKIDVLNLSKNELRRIRGEDISMVFQGAQSSWNPTMRIGAHFRETLKVHDADVSAGMVRARQLMEDLFLEPDRVMDAYPHELSGGMKQRALIALALVLDPEVLVLDEPTASLDLLMQRSIIALLNDIQEDNDLTMIFITHDLELVSDLADRLAVMYSFEFVEVGDSREVLYNSKHPYTRSLVNSIPDLNTPVERMRPIEGESPDPVNVPSGCSFHPRCPLADELCESEDPPLLNISEDQYSACHYWNDIDGEIPLNIEKTVEGTGSGSVSQPKDFEPTQSPLDRSPKGPVIELKDVHVHFSQSSGLMDYFSKTPDVKAVDGVDLKIGQNEVIALVGESGCGKTTLGKTAIGIHRPTSGSVEYRGQDIWEAKDRNGESNITYEEIRRSLQIIHQDPGSSLNPNKTVLTNLSIPMKTWEPDLSAEDRRARIFGMLERVGMKPAPDYASRYPHQLSGGEQQRIALIRALLMNPDLILADEAVSALDVSLRVDMMDLFLELQNEFNTSFMFISHNLSNARYLAEKTNGRIGVMYLGELVEIGTAEEILKNPQHPYTQVLMWATPDIDPEADELSDPPVRKIDIPDATDPPDGCRFHTRCPEAREVCKQQTPKIDGSDLSGTQKSACFRAYEDHEYWNSPEID